MNRIAISASTATTMSESDITDWLNAAHANGVNTSIAELMRYRYQPLSLPIPRTTGSSVQAGQRLSRLRGRGMEFDEVRHYQAGDDIRAIDWRVTARTGQTHTKLFREEKERPVFVCVDLSSSMWFGSKLLLKSVQAAHIAAGVAWHTVKRGDRIGGVVLNNQHHVELKPAARQHGALLLLRQLVALHPQNITAPHVQHSDSNSLNTQLQRLIKLCKPGADVVIISDFSQLNSQTTELLQVLRKHHTVSAVVITDPFEERLPADFRRDIDAFDGVQQHRLYLSSDTFRKDWQQQAQNWHEQRAQALKKVAIRTIEISAALPATMQWRRWQA